LIDIPREGEFGCACVMSRLGVIFHSFSRRCVDTKEYAYKRDIIEGKGNELLRMYCGLVLDVLIEKIGV
jgi:hypothetical protein